MYFCREQERKGTPPYISIPYKFDLIKVTKSQFLLVFPFISKYFGQHSWEKRLARLRAVCKKKCTVFFGDNPHILT